MNGAGNRTKHTKIWVKCRCHGEPAAIPYLYSHILYVCQSKNWEYVKVLLASHQSNNFPRHLEVCHFETQPILYATCIAVNKTSIPENYIISSNILSYPTLFSRLQKPLPCPTFPNTQALRSLWGIKFCNPTNFHLCSSWNQHRDDVTPIDKMRLQRCVHGQITQHIQNVAHNWYLTSVGFFRIAGDE